MKSWLLRLLREPLLHFLLIGGAIFLAHDFLADDSPADAETIVVSPARIERIRTLFQEAWQRPPTRAELEGLVAGDVREEIYYREALALGLDRDDAVIRRRMRQKMEFLIDTGSQILMPDETTLQAWYTARHEDYRTPLQLDFEQIFLGARPSSGQIDAALRQLRENGAAARTVGETTLLPPVMHAAQPPAVDGVFGPGFFARLETLPTGTWQGPVRSAYGVHLVRVQARLGGEIPPLEQVREQVLRQWRMEKARELRDRDYAERRRRYRVRVEWPREPAHDD